jgi:cystathionine gamma-synthase
MSRPRPETRLVTGARPTEAGAPLNVPLVLASNFLLGAGPVYTRDDSTPTWLALEHLVGDLEGGESVAFASGMAAAAAVFDQLPTGAEVALPDDCYQGVTRLAEKGRRLGHWTLRQVPVTDTPGWLAAMMECELVWLESPSNPLLEIADLPAICAAPRKDGTLLVIDNTVATPLNQQPLALGADVSMQSGTKFLGGHSDLLMGLLSTANPELAARFHQARKLNGATPGSLEAYLAVRGMRTLALRLERAQANAMALAAWLDEHPAIEHLRYPGLASHPGHALARAQMRGFGSLITFEARGGAQAAERLCQRTQVIRHATSLGSVESTMERRSAQPGQQHLPAGLVRLSVGIESVDDLRDDLEQALD